MSEQRVVMNANLPVYVRLTERGLQVLRDRAADVRRRIPAITTPYQEPVPDERGFYRFQLWQFLEDFGPYSGLGCRPCYHLDLEFNPADFRSAEATP